MSSRCGYAKKPMKLAPQNKGVFDQRTITYTSWVGLEEHKFVAARHAIAQDTHLHD
jgi:hypothetical protein